MKVPLVYKPGPLFGCDIGSSTVKVVQLSGGRKPKVIGYGTARFSAKAIAKGVISDPDELAKVIKELIARPQVGRIQAQRVAIAIPVSKVFVRTMHVPKMEKKDLEQAVMLQVEQYVPVPVNDLYVDYEMVTVQDKEEQEVQVVAAPRAIVDSYIKLFDSLGLFVEAAEVSLSAITRAMLSAPEQGKAAMVVDFGSLSADLTVTDQIIRLTATIPVGGETITQAMVKGLSISAEQATEIKYKFGIADSGLKSTILDALKPQLDTIVAEMTKAIKYYRDRSAKHQTISKVVLTGGSANLPGLVEYLSNALKVPVEIGNPWVNLDTGGLQDRSDVSIYTTAIGLALNGAKR